MWFPAGDGSYLQTLMNPDEGVKFKPKVCHINRGGTLLMLAALSGNIRIYKFVQESQHKHAAPKTHPDPIIIKDEDSSSSFELKSNNKRGRKGQKSKKAKSENKKSERVKTETEVENGVKSEATSENEENMETVISSETYEIKQEVAEVKQEVIEIKQEVVDVDPEEETDCLMALIEASFQ